MIEDEDWDGKLYWLMNCQTIFHFTGDVELYLNR